MRKKQPLAGPLKGHVALVAGATRGAGRGIARTDHLEPEQVEALVARIWKEHGRLDILVNDISEGEARLAVTSTVYIIDSLYIDVLYTGVHEARAR